MNYPTTSEIRELSLSDLIYSAIFKTRFSAEFTKEIIRRHFPDTDYRFRTRDQLQSIVSREMFQDVFEELCRQEGFCPSEPEEDESSESARAPFPAERPAGYVRLGPFPLGVTSTPLWMIAFAMKNSVWPRLGFDDKEPSDIDGFLDWMINNRIMRLEDLTIKRQYFWKATVQRFNDWEARRFVGLRDLTHEEICRETRRRREEFERGGNR